MSRESDMTALKAYFQGLPKLDLPIRLDAGQRIVDLNTFLQRQYDIIEGGKPGPVADACYHRLVLLRQVLMAREKPDR